MSPYISIDAQKKTIDGYDPNHAEKFHSLSAKLANREFQKELKKEHVRKVILMAGGSASGKTEFASLYLKDYYERDDIIVFDSTLPTYNGAKIKIDDCNKKNITCEIYFIIPSDLKIAYVAFLHREQKIPEEKFFDTHVGSRKTILKLAKESDINIKVYESKNLEGKLTYEEITLNRDELISFLEDNQLDRDNIRNIILN